MLSLPLVSSLPFVARIHFLFNVSYLYLKIVHSPPLLPRKTVDKKQIGNEKKNAGIKFIKFML